MKKSLSPRQIFERSITEEDVISAGRALLEFNGASFHRVRERIPWGKTTSEPGIPDTFFSWPEPHPYAVYGTCWWEAKRPGKKATEIQKAWLDRAFHEGQVAFEADSVEAMVKALAFFGIEIKGLQ